MKRPKVSVIIPNYNHASYLEKRIESVLQQSYTDYELIVLDDASTDDSVKIIERLQRKNPSIQFYPNESNSGSPFAQWNKGMLLAKGDYVWIAESDDYCEPNLLEKLIETIEQDDRIVLAYAQSYLVDEQDQIINNYLKNLRFIYKSQAWEKDFVKDGNDACKEWLVYNNPIPNASGALIRKSRYEAVGGADTAMRLNGDWQLYAKLLVDRKLAFHAKPLNYFRVHQNTQRHKARATADTYLELIKINDFLRANVPDIEAAADKALYRISSWWASSLPRQIKTLENQRKNRKLYRLFKQKRPGLAAHVFFTYLTIGSRFILKRIGLLKPAKRVRELMFPGKYFNS
jgi:glycosyltransferase involved in cell wall biosynthesis